MAISRIDPAKCTGCGACANSCAMDVIHRDCFPQAGGELTPCSLACPARVNMRGYIHLLNQGKMEEAISLIREELPMPAVTGHVCFHPCEEQCARSQVDEPVNINGLERYVADYWLNEKPAPIPQIYGRRVAIIGAGPAGLAAGYGLVKMGYPVTVFDAAERPGGMLRLGIPDFRLPPSILDAQIDYIRGLGVDLKTGISFGRDFSLEYLKDKGYEAVLLSIGAQLARKISIEGSDLEGVFWGLDFLKDVKAKRDVRVGERVVVVGGGNVAVDAALTAFRLGATRVRIVCLESTEEMPAHRETLEVASAEGVEVVASWGPKRVVGSRGKVAGVEFVCCLSIFDEKQNFAPAFDEGRWQLMEADSVILAIGEAMDETNLPEGLKTREGRIVADPLTMQTNLPGVFAAGVAVSGPSSVVEAIASGKSAALSIDRFLKGQDLRQARDLEVPAVKKPPREGIERRKRQESQVLPVDQRQTDFREIRAGLTFEAAQREQQRCMACGSKAFIKYSDDCMTCYTCEKDCPENAIYVSPEHLPIGVSCW